MTDEVKTTPDDELAALKNRADILGISYSPRIGVDALREKINARLSDNDDKADTEESDKVEKTRSMQAEFKKLIRIRLTCMNPQKAKWPGEIITVRNKYVGTIRRLIPFGEATDNGYHVEQILLDELRDRKFLQVTTNKDGEIKSTKFVPEFAIEVLEPLTEEELERIAAAQTMRGGLDD